IFYAMKANSNLAVLTFLAGLGAGADTVSEGEIRRALAAGIPASRIVLSGVGKSDNELAFAVETGIYQINIETEGELHDLSRIAQGLGMTQAAVLRINPDIGAGGHAKITTGSAENKFGVSLDDVERLYGLAETLPGVAIEGLAMHIGSQIRHLGDLTSAAARMRALVLRLREKGHVVNRIDLGGGLGIPYEMAEAVIHDSHLIQSYAEMVRNTFQSLDVELGFEPGRIIVGNAGVLLSKVLQLNKRPKKTFAVVDAAMNDLVRPAMYGAYHEIWPVRESTPDVPEKKYDVVGPICETGDTFCEGRTLTTLKPGDLVAFMTAGAYGAVMSSTYNSRRLVPEVLVSGGRMAVVRERLRFEDLLALDTVPDWLGKSGGP
ncbi:MAG: diaminopimelate decarboxylase, partial [Hyphomicrobiaceae bacterium]